MFGRGTLTFIRPANRAVLAYVRQLGDEAILCVANLSRSAQAVELDLCAVEGPHPAGDARPHALSAASANCPIWSRCRPTASSGSCCCNEAEHEPEKVLPREITTLVLGPGWDSSLLAGWTRRTLEHDVLPGFLPDRRWFADKGARRIATEVSGGRADRARRRPFRSPCIVDVTGAHGVSRYFLPLTIRWTRYTAIDRGAGQRARRRTPRPARGHAARCRAPSREFIAALLGKIHAGDDRRR